MSALGVIEKFWEKMKTNDFRPAGSLLANDFVLEWPQSNERIRGRDNYAAMNEQYPAHDRWEFTINRIVGNDVDVVTDVTVTDGDHRARAISSFTVRTNKITYMTEFWLEPFPRGRELEASGRVNGF